MRHTEKHIHVLAIVLAFLMLTGGFRSGMAQDVTPAGSPPPIPATPVGDQLTWVLAQFNGEADALSETEISDHFAPAFLRTFLPAPVLLELMRQTAAQYAPVAFTGFAYPPTDNGSIALVEMTTGEQGAIYLTVEPEPPHRITRLDLNEAPAPESATGRRVDIGERALYLDCVGSGAPTVVLEGGITSDWAAVQPAVAANDRVCSYDRPDSPGSRSDPAPQRNAQQVVDDLRALLTAAGESGPFVLVGHSMGGLYVQLYASEYPTEVAGLVLVDPTPEDFSTGLGEIVESLGTPIPTPAGEPSPEELSFQQMREARSSHPLQPMPLIVLSHGRADDPSERPPGWPMEREEQLLRDLHEEIAHLVPNGRHLIAEGSGHDIHQERPDLVVEAINAVVEAVRNPNSWPSPASG
jgi:pimeloyl-ACP methyl ester carboxylesterase